MNSVIHEAIRDFNSWHPGQPITTEVTKALMANPPTRVTDRNERKRMIASMIEMYRHLDHSLVLLVINGRPLLLEISEYQDLAEALYDSEGEFIERGREESAQNEEPQADKVFAASVDDGADTYQFVVLASDRETAADRAKLAYCDEVAREVVDGNDLEIGLTELDRVKCYHFFG